VEVEVEVGAEGSSFPPTACLQHSASASSQTRLGSCSLDFKMPFDISYEEICSKFDRLISNGIIQYQPSHPVLVTDNGMTVCSYRYPCSLLSLLI
jgi:hypothetical protein